MMTPPDRQAALERLYEVVGHCHFDKLPKDVLGAHMAVPEAVEQAAPEDGRLEECPRNCTTYQQYGDCDHRNPSVIAAAKKDLADARAALETEQKDHQHTLM